MSQFTEELLLTPTPDGDEWLVKCSFRYYVGHEGSDDFIDIPYDYQTDLASIPKFLWSILPPFGKYSQAAVVHDWLCRYRTKSSEETHRIFKECMEVLKVTWWKRKTMYYFVKRYGPKW